MGLGGDDCHKGRGSERERGKRPRSTPRWKQPRCPLPSAPEQHQATRGSQWLLSEVPQEERRRRSDRITRSPGAPPKDSNNVRSVENNLAITAAFWRSCNMWVTSGLGYQTPLGSRDPAPRTSSWCVSYALVFLTLQVDSGWVA